VSGGTGPPAHPPPHPHTRPATPAPAPAPRRYNKGDWLVFGSETSGLPDRAHEFVRSSGGVEVRIPMVEGYVRSINLSVSAGVGLFEAIRQRDDAAGRISDAYQLTDALGAEIPTVGGDRGVDD